MRPLIGLAQVLVALTCTLQGCGKIMGPGKDNDRGPGPRVGQPAPEIDGTDLDGAPLKLSDYRGKVILLSFYGEWCGYCVKQFPHERALVDSYRDRPFVLLGVNSDDNREEAKANAVRHGLTWRAFWAESPQGAIPRRYRLQGWPTFFLLDPQCVVLKVSHSVDRDMEIAINVALDALEHKQ
jgi:thiol-disulfide isomerase/thioredoxin